MCSALGVREHVASPTFTIVNEYNVEGRCIYHFDFYRVDSAREIFDLGVEEYFNSGGISLIEWAEKARQFLPPHRYEIRLELGDDRNSRSITVDEILEARS